MREELYERKLANHPSISGHDSFSAFVVRVVRMETTIWATRSRKNSPTNQGPAAGTTRKEHQNLSKTEMDIAKRLGDAFAALPDSKKERLLGYAEGVADMAEIARRVSGQEGESTQGDGEEPA